MAYTWGDIDQMTTADWHANFATTVDGTFFGTRTAMRLMKEQGGGSIVNIASICGLFGTAQMAGYSAAKAAVINFSRAAASEGAPHNIRCNVIIPGVVDTPHIRELYEREGIKQGKTPEQVEQGYIDATPIRRTLAPIEMGWLIGFLASPKAGAVTGESIGIDGGLTRGIFI